jgi:hypothetical protein
MGVAKKQALMNCASLNVDRRMEFFNLNSVAITAITLAMTSGSIFFKGNKGDRRILRQLSIDLTTAIEGIRQLAHNQPRRQHPSYIHPYTRVKDVESGMPPGGELQCVNIAGPAQVLSL